MMASICGLDIRQSLLGHQSSLLGILTFADCLLILAYQDGSLEFGGESNPFCNGGKVTCDVWRMLALMISSEISSSL